MGKRSYEFKKNIIQDGRVVGTKIGTISLKKDGIMVDLKYTDKDTEYEFHGHLANKFAIGSKYEDPFMFLGGEVESMPPIPLIENKSGDYYIMRIINGSDSEIVIVNENKLSMDKFDGYGVMRFPFTHCYPVDNSYIDEHWDIKPETYIIHTFSYTKGPQVRAVLSIYEDRIVFGLLKSGVIHKVIEASGKNFENAICQEPLRSFSHYTTYKDYTFKMTGIIPEPYADEFDKYESYKIEINIFKDYEEDDFGGIGLLVFNHYVKNKMSNEVIKHFYKMYSIYNIMKL